MEGELAGKKREMAELQQEEARKLPGVERVYENDEIRVLWEPGLCIHVGECFRRAPRVFKPRERPWVKLDQGTTEATIAAVKACPTSALRFEMVGDAAAPGDDEPARLPEVEIRPDGPLYIYGPVRIVDEQRGIDRVENRVVLCRCGQSKNKPFCDNSHSRTNFRSS